MSIEFVKYSYRDEYPHPHSLPGGEGERRRWQWKGWAYNFVDKGESWG